MLAIYSDRQQAISGKNRSSPGESVPFNANMAHPLKQTDSFDGSLAQEGQSTEKLYLDLMKKCLTGLAFPCEYAPIHRPKTLARRLPWALARKLLAPFQLEFVRRVHFDPVMRSEGLDWPASAVTMVGLKRLNNLESCITDVIGRRVPGDLIETGVWRGGAAIFMRAALKAYHDNGRTVWVADSFRGLPKPDPDRYPADRGDTTWKCAGLAVSLDEVKQNFTRFGLLDDRVRFLEGWFRDTLPNAPIERLAVLRLDGDLYESTMIALESLYPRLSIGGYVIIDDYVLQSCRTAVEDFRARHKITEEVRSVDQCARYWQRQG